MTKEQITSTREKLGYSMAEISLKTGWHRSTIWRIENGKIPVTEKFIKALLNLKPKEKQL